MFTQNDLFDIAVRMEENGKAVYCRAMENTTESTLLELLQWMADEEGLHSQWFANQKQLLPKGKDDLEVVVPDIIQEMMGENSLSLDEVDFGMIKDPVQLLKTFVMFENDTILFYEFLDTFIESETVRQGLKQIVAEETAHVEKLNLMIASFTPRH